TAAVHERRIDLEVAPWYELSRALDRFHWGTGSAAGPAFRETSLDLDGSPHLGRAMQLIEVPDGITVLPTKQPASGQRATGTAAGRWSSRARVGSIQQLIGGVAT